MNHEVHYASHLAFAVITAGDVHIADAVGDVERPYRVEHHSRQPVSVRGDPTFDGKVLDGGFAKTFERGYIALCAGVPVDLQRVSLSVERAGVEDKHFLADHDDVLAQVHVGGHLYVEMFLASVHGVAEDLPVVLRRDLQLIVDSLLDNGNGYGAVGVDGGVSREVVGKCEGIIIIRVVCRA